MNFFHFLKAKINVVWYALQGCLFIIIVFNVSACISCTASFENRLTLLPDDIIESYIIPFLARTKSGYKGLLALRQSCTHFSTRPHVKIIEMEPIEHFFHLCDYYENRKKFSYFSDFLFSFFYPLYHLTIESDRGKMSDIPFFVLTLTTSPHTTVHFNFYLQHQYHNPKCGYYGNQNGYWKPLYTVTHTTKKLKINEFLTQKRWSTYECAERAGLSESYLQSLINETCPWNEYCLNTLAHAFDVTPSELLGEPISTHIKENCISLLYGSDYEVSNIFRFFYFLTLYVRFKNEYFLCQLLKQVLEAKIIKNTLPEAMVENVTAYIAAEVPKEEPYEDRFTIHDTNERWFINTLPLNFLHIMKRDIPPLTINLSCTSKNVTIATTNELKKEDAITKSALVAACAYFVPDCYYYLEDYKYCYTINVMTTIIYKYGFSIAFLLGISFPLASLTALLFSIKIIRFIMKKGSLHTHSAFELIVLLTKQAHKNAHLQNAHTNC